MVALIERTIKHTPALSEVNGKASDSIDEKCLLKIETAMKVQITIYLDD